MTPLPTPGQAFWNQRHVLARQRQRLRALIEAVGRPTDLCPFQWAQLLAFTLEWEPDLIVELGRGRGNSTCCFLEACSLLPRACRLQSYCLSTEWFDATLPRLQELCSPAWFARGQLQCGDIRSADFAGPLARSRRTLVFWDAHGFDVAEHVLGRVLPLLQDRPHAVVMHDVSDLRYAAPPRDYDGCGLWKGENATDDAFWLGHIFSRVAQTVSVIDFTTRNQVPFHSADESLHAEFGNDPARVAVLQELLDDDFVSLQAHWFWFSLHEAARMLTFPTVQAVRECPAITANGPVRLLKKSVRAGMKRARALFATPPESRP